MFHFAFSSGKNFLLLLLLVASVSSKAQWSTASLSQGRSKAYPVVVGKKAFFIGGEIQGDDQSKVVDVYNDSTGKWSSFNLTFGTGNYLNAPAITGKGLIFVIQTGEIPTSVINIIDAETQSVRTDTLSFSRTNISLGVVGDWVVFAGGNTNIASDRVDMYNTKTQTWSKASLSIPRSFSAAAAIGYKLFIAGGVNENGPVGRVDIFDAETGLWDTASLSVPRAMMTTLQAGNKLLFAGGGVLDFIYFNAVDIYDAETGTWSSAKLSQEVFTNILRGASVGSKAFFTGGSLPNNVDIFDAVTGKWTVSISPTSHQFNPVVPSGNKVFFAGGLNNPTGKVDIYDVTTEKWVNGGKLSTARYYAAGAAVGNKILFAGGSGNSKVVDIYTLPASGLEEAGEIGFEGTFTPNPASDEATLAFPYAVSGLLQLFDVRGIPVLSRELQQVSRYDFSLGSLPPGCYIWHWIDRESRHPASGKIAVVR